jgi:hypothetical protein
MSLVASRVRVITRMEATKGNKGMETDELNQYLIKRVGRLMYDSYMQELISEALVDFWSRFEAVSSLLIAVTATGSTVAGWAVWKTGSGIIVWGAFSGIASLLAVISGTLQIPTRIKSQNELGMALWDIGQRAEALYEKVRALDNKEIEKQLTILDREYREAMKKTHRDMIMTRKWRARLQKLLNERMEEKGYAKHRV